VATEIKINIFLTTHYNCKHIHNAFHLFQSILPIQKHMSLDHSLRLEWRSISILISILTSSYGQVTCASGWAQYKLKWNLINPALKRTGAWLQCNAYCLTSYPVAKMLVSIKTILFKFKYGDVWTIKSNSNYNEDYVQIFVDRPQF